MGDVTDRIRHLEIYRYIRILNFRIKMTQCRYDQLVLRTYLAQLRDIAAVPRREIQP